MSDVSVIVLTYNADWNKLRMTLNSVLLQKNVDFQIIIADDGSESRFDKHICRLFETHNFKNYVFVNSDVNGGTVKNLYNGLTYAEGNYIKPISPGDFFYDNSALSGWIRFMKKSSSLFSFGDSVYYNNLKISESISSENNVSVSADIINGKSSPARLDLYTVPQDRKKIFVDYLLANDTVLGAAVMAETELYKKYVEKITGRLIYAEDYLARLLVFDGIMIDRYPEKVIWYEYGTGASNGASEKWAALLHRDFEESNRIIMESSGCFDYLSEKYQTFLKESSEAGLMHKIKKCAAFPALITARLDKRAAAAPSEADQRFLAEIL